MLPSLTDRKASACLCDRQKDIGHIDFAFAAAFHGMGEFMDQIQTQSADLLAIKIGFEIRTSRQDGCVEFGGMVTDRQSDEITIVNDRHDNRIHGIVCIAVSHDVAEQFFRDQKKCAA